MKHPPTPLLLRLWLGATRVFAGPIARAAKSLHARTGAAPERFGERLGQPHQSSNRPVIWFHAASLGEVSQIGPLVDGLRDTATADILVTTTTEAGADWVARALPDAHHQFAPIDTPAAVHGFLNAWNINIAIFIEGDLGPRLVLEAEGRGIPLLLLNARHSRTRARFPGVFARLLAGFEQITCRSEEVAKGLTDLGLPESRIKTLPDLRIATARLPCPADRLAELSDQIGKRPLWLAASTHEADENAVLSAHRQVLEHHPDALLIVAPRHPRRGTALETNAQAQGFACARRSTDEALRDTTQVYIADTLGELGLFFTLAPIAFIGGSFGDEGGHNPYEPASFGTAILSGPNVKNFAEAYAALAAAGAAEMVAPEALGHRLIARLGAPEVQSMGTAGRRFMEASEDSLNQTVDLINTALSASGS